MKRRLMFTLPIFTLPMLAAGCSVLPDRPFIESRRFILDPRRQGPMAGRPRQAILLRTMRAAPGLELRGLRRLRANGTMDIAPFEEWLAPPAELAEQALRQWLVASGRFSGVTAPGSRLEAFFILETELLALQVGPEGARAALAVLLLTQPSGLGEPRLRGQTRLEALIPVPPGADAASHAAAMEATMARVFTDLETWLVSLV